MGKIISRLHIKSESLTVNLTQTGQGDHMGTDEEYVYIIMCQHEAEFSLTRLSNYFPT